MSKWTPEKRAKVNKKIVKEARSAAVRLGAAHVMIIAFYPDGAYLHTQDGGSSPVPCKTLYRELAKAYETMEESGGKDVVI